MNEKTTKAKPADAAATAGAAGAGAGLVPPAADVAPKAITIDDNPEYVEHTRRLAVIGEKIAANRKAIEDAERQLEDAERVSMTAEDRKSAIVDAALNGNAPAPASNLRSEIAALQREGRQLKDAYAIQSERTEAARHVASMHVYASRIGEVVEHAGEIADLLSKIQRKNEQLRELETELRKAGATSLTMPYFPQPGLVSIGNEGLGDMLQQQLDMIHDFKRQLQPHVQGDAHPALAVSKAKTKARVLCDLNYEGKAYKIDDEIELDENGLRDHRSSVDTHPDALKHAKAARALRRLPPKPEIDTSHAARIVD